VPAALVDYNLKTRISMNCDGEEAERLQQLVAESVAGFVKRASDKDAALKALQANVDEPQRDKDHLISDSQSAKRQRLSSQMTHGDVLLDDGILQQVLEYVGPDEYLFSASTSKKCRQMQFTLSYKEAAKNNRTKDKLRTSLTAALASPTRLQWAFSSGLKKKDKYYKPLQLVQLAMNASTDPTSVLKTLNVCSFKLQKVDRDESSELCAEAAERGDLKLLKWLHKHECAWNTDTCSEAALKGRLDILQWARAHGCPWDEDTCWCAAQGGYLRVLQWARETGCPWDTATCSEAARFGHLPIIEWARANSCSWNEDTCWCAAQSGFLNVLQWAREHGCPWDKRLCEYAARHSHLYVLQWARANGCPWDLDDVLPEAAANGNVTMLEWLQQSSERPWTAAKMSEMLDEAGSHDKLQAAKWLRERGAEWPSSFYSYDNSMECMISWSVETVKWALSEGCTWGDWQCEKLAPELYDEDAFREDAVELLAWAHENGCPCTCGNSSGGSNTQ
jgi:hypothetical protein